MRHRIRPNHLYSFFCFLSLCLFLTQCGPAKRPCTDVSACLADEVCSQGFCQNPCKDNGDCLGDQQCQQGVCLETQGDGGTPDGQQNPDGSCQPTTCVKEGKNCGQIPNGCGGTLQCGDCPQGESCGAGGQSNVCGAGTCTPKTCEEQGLTCGQGSDGCGKTLDCGSCEVCAPSCPESYTCKQGVCAEGNPQALTLEGKTYQVSGTVLLNGAAPRVIGPACTPTSEYEMIRVRFVEPTYNYNIYTDILCKDFFAQKAAKFSISLYPGIYKVSVSGLNDQSNFPNAAQVIVSKLRIP